jgi:hypothetical protein
MSAGAWLAEQERKRNAVLVVTDGLAEQINSAHEAAEQSLRASVEHAVRAGQLLIEAKRVHGRHGQWIAWLQQNIKFSDRLAQAYMRLARLPVEKRNAVADLPLREALSAIRSRERFIADLNERERNWKAREGDSPLVAVKDGKLYEGKEAIGLEWNFPPSSPPTPAEVADDLIEQFAQAAYEVRSDVNADHIREAFERRFGEIAVDLATKSPPESKQIDDTEGHQEEVEQTARRQQATAVAQQVIDEVGIYFVKRVLDAVDDWYINRALRELVAGGRP